MDSHYGMYVVASPRSEREVWCGDVPPLGVLDSAGMAGNYQTQMIIYGILKGIYDHLWYLKRDL